MRDCDKMSYPDPCGMPPPPECANEAGRMPRRPTAQRKQELMTLAIGIAAQVSAAVRPGEERCMLRRMVEMFLDD